MPRMRFQNLFVIAPLLSWLTGCVTFPNNNVVTVPDKLSRGGIWAQTNGPRSGDLTLNEMIDFIEPQNERTCVPVGIWVVDPNGNKTWRQDFPVCAENQKVGTPVTMPARAGAVMLSADDYSKTKTAIEQACRQLGAKCDYEKILKTGSRIDQVIGKGKIIK